MTRAAVAGTFDVLHDGHKALLRRAFEVGDQVVVGITSDRMASSSRGVTVPVHIRRAELESYLSELGVHLYDRLMIVKHEPFEGPVVVQPVAGGDPISISYKAAHNLFINEAPKA